jgi:hypothetical protein
MIMTLIKTLMVVVGLLIAVGGVYAAWLGLGAIDNIRGLEQEIYKQTAENAYGRGGGEAGKQKIADSEHKIEEKKVERNIWFGVAVGGLVVGLSIALLPLALLPSSRKRKDSAAKLAPAPDQGAPSL